jgi:ribonuclease D
LRSIRPQIGLDRKAGQAHVADELVNMGEPPAGNTALTRETASDDIRLVTEQSELDEACARLAEGEFLALDTEFHRESTYWPQLCLVQAATADYDVLIDPLADLDLGPFLQLIADPSRTKVFHAARQDLEIFARLIGAPPGPIFDTQIAAMAAGLGDSISYENIVSKLLKAQVDKSSQFTDWTRRPLSEKQLAYARGDVTHLRQIYAILRDRLAKRDRLHWIEEEHAALLDPSLYAFDPKESWRRLKPRKMKADYLAVLASVAAWREALAQELDKPRGRILKDDAIQEIALQRPRTGEALERMRAVPAGFSRSRHGQGLIDAITRALDDPAAYAPELEREEPMGPPAGALGELLKVLLRQIAEEADVAPRLIANAADIERIARDDDPDVAAMRGWRREVFGEKALALKAGRLALAAKGRGVKVIEV